MPWHITLPETLDHGNLHRFIELLGTGNSAGDIRLDLSKLRFVTPGPLVALVARVTGWRREGKQVELVGWENSQIFAFLQRMDLCNQTGYTFPEAFERHNASQRFVPLTRVGNDQSTNVSHLASDVASCMVPDDEDDWETGRQGAFGYVQFAVAELVKNVLHHARGPGFVAAQYYPAKDLVRVAIGDCGIGILQSFVGTGYWRSGMTSTEATEVACRPRVSSKGDLAVGWGGDPVNQGLGLPYLTELARSSGGSMLVISGDGYYGTHAAGALASGQGFQGTICALSVRRASADRYDEYLRAAEEKLNPQTGLSDIEGVFQ